VVSKCSELPLSQCTESGQRVHRMPLCAILWPCLALFARSRVCPQIVMLGDSLREMRIWAELLEGLLVVKSRNRRR
jgi:hypothetical protein